MIRTSSRFVVAAALALLAASHATPASAQTFEACRVPSVGVIYMINVGDAPTACLDASHVQFSWTEGGAPPDNSVTSASIVDGAVATADLANGAVTTGKLAAPPSVVQASSNGAGGGGMTSSTYVSNGSVSITAPAAGRIILIATGTSYVSNRDTLISFSWGTAAGSGLFGSLGYVGFGEAALVTTTYIPFSLIETVAVAAGTYTYYLNANRFWGTGTADMFGIRLRAMFIPT